MLILVLIPAIAAEGAGESFYIEYVDDFTSEAIVEESISTDIIEYNQQEASYSSNFAEVDVGSEISDIEYSSGFTIQSNSINQSIEDNYDAVLILEQENSPVFETQAILEETENDSITTFIDEIISDIDSNDIYESSDEELTVEDTGVIKQDSLFYLKHENIIYLTFKEIYDNTINYNTSGFKRTSVKILELKNDLLINQDIKNVFSEDIFELDGDAIVCINKATTDFIFSIDNSVIGDEKLVFLVCSFSCFNFIPFDAFCDFLDADCFLDVTHHTKHYNDSFLFNSYFNINMSI